MVNKKQLINDYKLMQKFVKKFSGSLNDFYYEMPSNFDKFENYIYSSFIDAKCVDFNYANMTLSVRDIDNKLVLSDEINIWDDSGIGWYGLKTFKELEVENKYDLD